MNIIAVGKPNLQRFAETFMQLLAEKEGMEIVPGSVVVERRSKCETERKEESARR